MRFKSSTTPNSISNINNTIANSYSNTNFDSNNVNTNSIILFQVDTISNSNHKIIFKLRSKYKFNSRSKSQDQLQWEPGAGKEKGWRWDIKQYDWQICCRPGLIKEIWNTRYKANMKRRGLIATPGRSRYDQRVQRSMIYSKDIASK